MTMFCDVALAGRIERAEVSLMEASSRAAARRRGDGRGFALPVGGGLATYAEADSPFNKVAGLGFTDVVPDLAEVERAFAEVGAPVQAEVATLGDPAVGELLSGRGYRLVGFENVLGRPIGRAADARTATEAQPAGRDSAKPRRTGQDSAEARAAGQDSIEVRLNGEGESEDEGEGFFGLVADAFADADTEGVPSHEHFPRQAVIDAMRDMGAAGVRRYTALRDGQPAGGASMRLAGPVAQMTGAATSTGHRRHGVQGALLAARLADAEAAGCEVAVVTTQPGSVSQRNVQRLGFHLLYSRAVLVKN